MLMPPAGLAVYVATKPVDFRKGADGLVLLAQSVLGHDPLKGVAVVFRAKRADRVNLVVWDGSGLMMYWKRLENGKFKWPPVVDGVMRMNAAQLAALLAGMEWTGRACTRCQRRRLRRWPDGLKESSRRSSGRRCIRREAWQNHLHERCG
jgi:transposase